MARALASRSWAWAWVLASAAAIAPGCGPDARLTAAEESVRVSASALSEVQTSGGENPALAAPLARVAVRLDEAERAIEAWHDHGGPLAFSTRAPCLRASLIALREAMLAESLDVPSDLDEAEALLEGADGRCTP
jgi:hypothetical protein